MADPSFSLKYWYENQKAIVRLTGEITNDSVFSLCDEIDLAIDYYHFPTIEIRLDSPGGNLRSLIFYLTKLKEWKEKKVSVATQGLTMVCSAAACILSMGDIGKRKVYSNTRLLYHQSSFSNVNSLTIQAANDYITSLQQSTGMMIDVLAQHVWDGKDSLIGVHPPSSLENIQRAYEGLFNRSQGTGDIIFAQEAIEHWLVDAVIDQPDPADSQSK
jgi:ATP-dependent protease ClpP protease subunit